MFLFSISDLSLTTIILIFVGVVALLIFIAALSSSSKYQSRYKRFYKKMERTINKKYNGNVLNEELINKYSRDNTNTFNSLKGRGKRKVKQYFDYYVKSIPELVMLKSFTSSDKNKNEISIILLDDIDKVVNRWHKGRKVKGIIKMCNKHQMLNSYIAFFYELPIHIHEGAPYRFTNHDNEFVLTYDIVKNPKRGKRKVVEKKLTRKQIKAQEKVEKQRLKREKRRK